jgi:hypothetical protein
MSIALALAITFTGVASILVAIASTGVECRDAAPTMWNVVIAVPMCALILIVPTHVVAVLMVSSRDAAIEDAESGLV